MSQQVLPNMHVSVTGFDSFVVGRNQQLIARLKSRADSVGNHEPLFLWGERGVGKTHLLDALGERASRANLQTIVFDCASVASLPVAAIASFERLDLLAFDNIQVVAHHPNWQQAIFHLYNRAIDTGTTLVFAADTSPLHLDIALRDLTSRLAAAETYRVYPLDEDNLRLLLRSSARQQGMNISTIVADYILRRCERNPGALRDLLNSLDQASWQAQRKITIPFVKDSLGW